MWDVVRSAVGTTQLVWLKGSKGFVYTEAQPTGACTSVGGIVSCPMSGPSYTAVKGKTTFNVPDRPQPYVTRPVPSPCYFSASPEFLFPPALTYHSPFPTPFSLSSLIYSSSFLRTGAPVYAPFSAAVNPGYWAY